MILEWILIYNLLLGSPALQADSLPTGYPAGAVEKNPPSNGGNT